MANLWLSDDDCRFNLPRVIDDGGWRRSTSSSRTRGGSRAHQVKRLFSPPFVDLLAAKLQPGGLLHFKSDVQEYADLCAIWWRARAPLAPHDPELAERIGEFALTHRGAWCLRNQRPVYASLRRNNDFDVQSVGLARRIPVRFPRQCLPCRHNCRR